MTLVRATRELGRQWPWVLLALAVVVFVLAPVVPLQWQALDNGAAGIRALADLPGFWDVVVMTLAIGFGALAVAMVLGTSLALAVQALPDRLRRGLAFTPALPLVIPGIAHVVGFVFLFSPESGYINAFLRMLPFFSELTTGPINVYQPFWIIMYTGINLAAFVYLFVRTGLQNLGDDFGMAARVNGAGAGRVLWTVTLPMLRPTLVYASVVVLLLSLGQFTGPLMLGRREGVDVLTTQMFALTQRYPIDYAIAASLGTPLLVVALILVVVQRRLIGDQNRFVGRGVSSVRQAPRSRVGTALATVYVVLYVLLAAVLPILALGFVSLTPYWSGNLSLELLTTKNYVAAFSEPDLLVAVGTTLLVTLLAIAVVLPLGMLVALAIYNRHRLWKPVAAVIDAGANLPLAVPAALIGFGFLFAYSLPGVRLYGTTAGLVIAYITIMLPFAVRYQLATLISVGRATSDASLVAGAGPARTFFRIIMPLGRSGLASSAALIFILLVHEFGVSVLLRAPGTTVMSVLLFDEYGGGSYPMVAVIALVMTVVTSVGVIAALIFGGTRALERI